MASTVGVVELPIDPDELCRVLREHGVVYAYVFGSRAHGTARPGSDVDVAVAGDVDEWSLRAALPEEVDLTVLDAAPKLLAGRVANEGRVLFDDDPPARVRWEAHTRKVHADERFRRARYRRDFAAAAVRAADG